MLATELWSAMHGVAAAAKRDKVPGGLRDFGKTAVQHIASWHNDERMAIRFATRLFSGPTNLWTTTEQLPEHTASACWRLLSLLEYLVNLDGQQNNSASC